jgi:S-adenosylmethionine-dependent methyltransferase
VQIDTGRERSRTGRLGLISTLLSDVLVTLARPDHPVSVLDCGGGSGTYSVPLAAEGADVTVVDISADALAILSHRATEAGVARLVHPLQGDVEALAEVIDARQFDLVLAHGILEAVDDVPATFTRIAAAVRPGGLLSVLVGNPAASVLARALAGDPQTALAELRELDAQPGLDYVVRLSADVGLTVRGRRGVGTFSDLIPGAALDAPGARDAVDNLDTEAAERSPFVEIAARVHLLLHKPG